MNLNHVATFLAVAEEGSVSKGAERLHISQPAVSKQLRDLERSLNVALFYRLSTGVRLTDAGELLLGYARDLFALEAQAEHALRDLRELRRGTLTVGASTTIGNYLLPKVCAAFGGNFPGVALRLEINNTARTQKLLQENAIDLALTEGFVEAPNLSGESFYEDEIVAVASTQHALANEASLNLAQLVGSPFVLREAGSGTRDIIQRTLDARGLNAAPAMTLGHTEAIKRALEGGELWAFLSRLAVEPEIAAGSLKVLPVTDWQVTRSFHRLKLRGKYEGRAVREFMRALRGSVRQQEISPISQQQNVGY
jgi:DNA-binding transcriptional LysR family regulator